MVLLIIRSLQNIIIIFIIKPPLPPPLLPFRYLPSFYRCLIFLPVSNSYRCHFIEIDTPLTDRAVAEPLPNYFCGAKIVLICRHHGYRP